MSENQVSLAILPVSDNSTDLLLLLDDVLGKIALKMHEILFPIMSVTNLKCQL